MHRTLCFTPFCPEIPNASSGAVSIISTIISQTSGPGSNINPKKSKYVVILFILVVNQMITIGLTDIGNLPKPRITGAGLPAEFGLSITPNRPTTALHIAASLTDQKINPWNGDVSVGVAKYPDSKLDPCSDAATIAAQHNSLPQILDLRVD